MSTLPQLVERYRAPSSMLEGEAAPSPSDADFENEVAAPGEAALLPIGVNYYAPWRSAFDGLGEHSRRSVVALAGSGLPVALRHLADPRFLVDSDIAPDVIRQVDWLRRISFSKVPIAIHHMIIQHPRQLEYQVCPPGARLSGFEAERAVYAASIVYTSWERSTLSRELAEVLGRVGQVWVPCERNAEVFLSAGIRTKVVPCPYEPRTHGPSQIGAPYGSDAVPYGKRFYAIGKWEPRKNYHALIGAFLQAFTPKDRASLFIKTGSWGKWEKYPSPAQSLAWWAPLCPAWTPETIRQRVRVSSRMVSASELNELHRANNIYVSVSRGEAWDLPAFDAVAAGNTLVHTGYGGSEEYAEDEPSFVRIPWRLEPVEQPEYGWESNAEWAVASHEDIVTALRRAAPPPARVHRAHLNRYLSGVVGEEMRAHVLQLAGRLNAAVEDELAMAGGFG